MVGWPDFPVPSASSRKIKEMPLFCRTPPWQEVQFWLKIGRMSRLKSTGWLDQRDKSGRPCAQFVHVNEITATARIAAPSATLRPRVRDSFCATIGWVQLDLVERFSVARRVCDFSRIRPRNSVRLRKDGSDFTLFMSRDFASFDRFSSGCGSRSPLARPATCSRTANASPTATRWCLRRKVLDSSS